MEKLKIVPLGGLREVGKNSMLLIFGKEAIMIDCGMGFAGNDEFMEDDFYIPDFDAINSLGCKLIGVIITHGHEDHIGGIPYLLQKFDVPVYATEYAALVLKERMAKTAKYKNLISIPASKKDAFDVGPFNIKMHDVPHSIPEAKALEIKVGGYKLVHSGDFRCDNHKHSPFYKKFGDDVDILFMESTNIEHEGFSKNEEDVIDNIKEIIDNAPARVIVTAFSSNAARIKNIIDISIACGRTVGLLGRSVNMYTHIAESLGYLKLPPSIITDKTEIKRVPDNKLTLIVTGSQAEPRSIMKRMSLDMMKLLTVKYGDTILFSSKMIPGNEISIGRMIDHLVEKGANVFYENTANIHTSGHARKEEIILAVKDIKPKLVIPVHGHIRFLDHNVRTLRKEGFFAYMISDGDVLSYDKNGHALVQKIELETKIVSNRETGLIDLETLRERKRMARGGIMTIIMTADMFESELAGPIRIISAGIASKERMKKIEKDIKDMISYFFSKEIKDEPDWEEVQEEIRIRVRRYLTELTEKKPIVYSIIINMDEG